MGSISCIIPAYNEEKRLRSVLSVVSNHPLLTEVIVIDDGSTDRTPDIVRSFHNVRLLSNPQNIGKTASICRGVEESSHPHVMFLDGDLIGLTPDNIQKLVEPVYSGAADVAISLRNYYFWRVFGLDPLTGDRVVPKELFTKHAREFQRLPPFALEVCMNSIFLREQCSLAVVPWLNVHARIKSYKYGFVRGIRGEIRMWKEISQYITFSEMVRQFLDMRARARKTS